jgi:predicted nucleotidyltransferase
MEKQKVLQLVKNAVHEVDDQAEIILFGSRARGDFNKESDWDFLILTEKTENHQIRSEIWEKLFYAELEAEEIFGTVVHNKEEWEKYEVTPLYQFIKKDGIRL